MDIKEEFEDLKKMRQNMKEERKRHTLAIYSDSTTTPKRLCIFGHIRFQHSYH